MDALSGAYLDRIVRSVGVGLVVIDAGLHIRLWNAWMSHQTGIMERDALGRHVTELFPEMEQAALQRKVKQVLALDNQAFFDSRVNGYLLPIPVDSRFDSDFALMRQDCVLVPLKGEGEDLVCISIMDATIAAASELALRRVHERLEEQNRHDALTGLHTRAYVLGVLDGQIGRARAEGRDLSVILVDLDFFKTINDTHGHLAGDEALRDRSRLMQGHLRDDDAIGRYGGEEFLIVLPGTSVRAALIVAERLRAAFASAPVDWEGLALRVTASFGVTTFAGDTDPEGLIGRADVALYAAKERGRNRVVEWCPELAQVAIAGPDSDEARGVAIAFPTGRRDG